MDELTDHQRGILQNVLEVCPDTTEERARQVLVNCQWNADHAFGVLFLGEAASGEMTAAEPLLTPDENRQGQNLIAEGNRCLPTRAIYLIFSATFRVVRAIGSSVFGFLGAFLFGPSERSGFDEYFRAQFGDVHPLFFPGSFARAMSKARDEKKILAVYLHCETAWAANDFCKHVLASQAVCDLLTEENFVVWAGDITRMEAHHVATSFAVRAYPHFSLQLLTSQHATRTLGKVEGSADLDGTVAMLTSCVDGIDGYRQEMGSRSRYSDDRLLMAQQDAEFEESLAQDRKAEAEREAKRKEMEMRSAEAAREERLRKEREEQELADQQRVERERKMRSPEVAKQLQDAVDLGQHLTRIVVKLPSGQRIEQQFSSQAKLQLVYDAVACAPYLEQFAGKPLDIPVRFQLMTSYPSKALIDMEADLATMGLIPNAALLLKIIEDDD